MSANPNNLDERVAAGFGHEWSTFRQDDDRAVTGRPQGGVRQLFPGVSLGGVAAGCGRSRYRLRQRALVDAGGAAGRASASAGREPRSARGCESQSGEGAEHDISPGKRRRYSAAGCFTRFRVFAGCASPRPGHAGCHRRGGVQAEAGRAVPDLSLLRARQPAALVQGRVAVQQSVPDRDFALFPAVAAARQPDHRGRRVLAAGARRVAGGTHGTIDVVDPARGLQASQLLRDAHRRL